MAERSYLILGESMYSLCLTLGHNASAVLVEDGEVICGYEQERLTGVKSDSTFPELAISEINKRFNLIGVENVYISHWATFGNVSEMSDKYWKPEVLFTYCPNAVIHSHEDNLSHHDAHLAIAEVFAGRKYTWAIVADGFGNFNETVSIYYQGRLHHRCFGFDKSIGLFYQYATAYLDLKMNQDEYKLLGFESSVQMALSNKEISSLIFYAERYAAKFAKRILRPSLNPEYDLIAGIEALPRFKNEIHKNLKAVTRNALSRNKLEFSTSEYRSIISFFVQTVTELTLRTIVKSFGMSEVLLCGGVFMNVKANNAIAKHVNNICILPICGDQGCGLGVYQKINEDLKWPGHLFWGKRLLYPEVDSSIIYVDSVSKAINTAKNLLLEDKIVNMVNGAMEFGSRALGNTSTLANPTMLNVGYINMLNERETTMPMAGMCIDTTDYLQPYKVSKSLEYMIMTLDHIDKPFADNMGCHHKYPLRDVYSNRVQLVKEDNYLYDLLKHFKVGLINTSANYHGQTIPLFMSQIVEMHQFQKKRDKDDRLRTIVVRNT